MALLPNLLPSSTTTLQTLTISICLLSKMATAQNGDGGAASGNLPGTSAGNGAALGAAGPSQSSANLSIGATVAIAVIVGIAVILGTLTAVLFWQAKKRQWTVRETLRHSRRRVTSGIRKVTSPLTPHRTTFSRFNDAEDMQKLRPMGSVSASAGADPPPSFSKRERETAQNTFQNRQSGPVDLEKGPVSSTTTTMGHVRGQSGMRPKAPMLTIPGGGKSGQSGSGRKSEGSPDPPQTPMWAKFLGRT